MRFQVSPLSLSLSYPFWLLSLSDPLPFSPLSIIPSFLCSSVTLDLSPTRNSPLLFSFVPPFTSFSSFHIFLLIEKIENKTFFVTFILSFSPSPSPAAPLPLFFLLLILFLLLLPFLFFLLLSRPLLLFFLFLFSLHLFPLLSLLLSLLPPVSAQTLPVDMYQQRY